MSNLPCGCSDDMIDASIPLSDWEIEQIEGVSDDSQPAYCSIEELKARLLLDLIPF